MYLYVSQVNICLRNCCKNTQKNNIKFIKKTNFKI